MMPENRSKTIWLVAAEREPPITTDARRRLLWLWCPLRNGRDRKRLGYYLGEGVFRLAGQRTDQLTLERVTHYAPFYPGADEDDQTEPESAKLGTDAA